MKHRAHWMSDERLEAFAEAVHRELGVLGLVELSAMLCNANQRERLLVSLADKRDDHTPNQETRL